MCKHGLCGPTCYRRIATNGQVQVPGTELAFYQVPLPGTCTFGPRPKGWHSSQNLLWRVPFTIVVTANLTRPKTFLLEVRVSHCHKVQHHGGSKGARLGATLPTSWLPIESHCWIQKLVADAFLVYSRCWINCFLSYSSRVVISVFYCYSSTDGSVNAIRKSMRLYRTRRFCPNLIICILTWTVSSTDAPTQVTWMSLMFLASEIWC